MKSFQEEDILTQMAPQIFEVNFTSSCLCLPERIRAKLCSHFRDFWLIARLRNKEVNSSMKAGVFESLSEAVALTIQDSAKKDTKVG